MKKKDNYVILIIICLILISIVGLLFLSKDDKNQTRKNNETYYKIVNNYSRFFTVESCINTYLTLLDGNRTDDLLKVLDDEYKENNNITSNNVYDFINKLDGIYSFESIKIYYKEIRSNFIIYYVYGNLMEEDMEGIKSKKEDYYIVKFDLSNNTFSIAPYDGSIFKEEVK